jgi:hypothetical protein
MPVAEPFPTTRKYREGSIDVENDTLRIALFDDSTAYSIDRLNHEFVSDVLDGGTTAQELSDPTFARQTVSGAAVTVDSTDSEVVFDANDVTFSDLDGGEVVQGFLIYQQVGGDDTTPTDDPILFIEDELTNQNGNQITTNGSDVTIQFDGEGIVNLS